MSDSNPTPANPEPSTDEPEARPVPPEARIGLPTGTPSVGTTCEFDGSDSFDPDGAVREHLWAIERDDDVVDGGTGTTFSHAFDRPGVHEVHLTVTDEDGLWDTATARVEVEADTADR